MEGPFLIYVTPMPVDCEPVGTVWAGDASEARKLAAKAIKIGYEITLVAEWRVQALSTPDYTWRPTTWTKS